MVRLLHLVVRLGQRQLKCQARGLGEQLTESVRLARLLAHHAHHVADGLLGAQSSKRNNLGDLIFAKSFGDVPDDFVPTVILEVHVYVGHGHTFGVQEPLEGEVVLHRVDVGDAERVGHQRTGRRTPHPEHDVLLPCVLRELADQQEVRIKARGFDDFEFVIQSIPGGFVGHRHAGAEAFFRELPQVRLGGGALRQVRRRHQVARFAELEVAHFGHQEGVRDGFRVIREEARHLVVRLDVLLTPEPESVLIFNQLAGADAEERVMRRRVGLAQKVRVVGDDEREIEVAGNAHQAFVALLLLRDAVVLELHEVATLVKDLAVLVGHGNRPVELVLHQKLVDLAAQACGGANETPAVLPQHLPVNAGHVVETLERGDAVQAAQIAVALFIPGQQKKVVSRLIAPPFALVARLGGNVRLHPDDGLDALLLALPIEVHAPEHRAVVADGEGGLVEFHRPLDHTRNAVRSIEEAVFRVVMQVDEVGGAHGGLRATTGDFPDAGPP